MSLSLINKDIIWQYCNFQWTGNTKTFSRAHIKSVLAIQICNIISFWHFSNLFEFEKWFSQFGNNLRCFCKNVASWQTLINAIGESEGRHLSASKNFYATQKKNMNGNITKATAFSINLSIVKGWSDWLAAAILMLATQKALHLMRKKKLRECSPITSSSHMHIHTAA